MKPTNHFTIKNIKITTKKLQSFGLILLVLFIYQPKTKANTKTDSAIVCGSFEMNPTDSAKFPHFQKLVLTQTWPISNKKYYPVLIDEDKQFHIKIPVKELTKFEVTLLYDKNIDTSHYYIEQKSIVFYLKKIPSDNYSGPFFINQIDYLYLEPGDSIHIITKQNELYPIYLTDYFYSGKGAEKNNYLKSIAS